MMNIANKKNNLQHITVENYDYEKQWLFHLKNICEAQEPRL